jgi:sugar phosphate isomerase/epimerase
LKEFDIIVTAHDDILIGTMVKVENRPVEYIRRILAHGFESFELVFPKHLGDIDVKRLADEIRAVLAEDGNTAVISALAIYGNPLIDAQTAGDWSRLIDATAWFGCNLVCGFTGRIPGKPVPESLSIFKQVFAPLVKQAEEKNVRIAFENCDMHGNWESGDWNIAHAPAAWEMMFDAIPSDAIGLEWEPAHQMASFVDPLPQLRQWAHKVFHVHGKDATILWDVIRTRGIRGGEQFIQHRTPGFGQTNWTDVISILRMKGFRGSIDIEGWHDPVYRDELEMTGQVHGLNYLKQCRGGPFVANP